MVKTWRRSVELLNFCIRWVPVVHLETKKLSWTNKALENFFHLVEIWERWVDIVDLVRQVDRGGEVAHRVLAEVLGWEVSHLFWENVPLLKSRAVWNWRILLFFQHSIMFFFLTTFLTQRLEVAISGPFMIHLFGGFSWWMYPTLLFLRPIWLRPFPSTAEYSPPVASSLWTDVASSLLLSSSPLLPSPLLLSLNPRHTNQASLDNMATCDVSFKSTRQTWPWAYHFLDIKHPSKDPYCLNWE